MKKFLFPILLAAALLPALCQAQVPDTVYCRSPHYYYSNWYDTCPEFLRADYAYFNLFERDGYASQIVIQSDYTPEPLEIQGVSVMVKAVNMSSLTMPCRNNYHGPEWVFLFRKEGDKMVPIDSARWDTVPYKIAKMPSSADTVNYPFRYAHIHEARFKQPILVDSTFYLGGTFHSNEQYQAGNIYYRLYLPVNYVGMSSVRGSGFGCDGTPIQEEYMLNVHSGYLSVFHNENRPRHFYGCFMPIADNARLEVASDDPALGTAGTTGSYMLNTWRTIVAVPGYGNAFSRWNDGDTTNPRLIYLTQDTVFTAYFEENCRHHSVRGEAADSALGHVDGGGLCCDGDTVTLSAVPERGCVFYKWGDGRTENPRAVTVRSDTLLTAVFLKMRVVDHTEGVAAPEPTAFTLTPNPAKGIVTVAVEGTAYRPGQSVLHVADASGREVLSQPLAAPRQQLDLSALPAGVYFVTLSTPQASCTQRLVLE